MQAMIKFLLNPYISITTLQLEDASSDGMKGIYYVALIHTTVENHVSKWMSLKLQ